MSTAPTLDALTRSATDPDRLVLLRGGTVVTMDPTLGTIDAGDVLVRGERIVDVGRHLPDTGAIVVDATAFRRATGFEHRFDAHDVMVSFRES